MRVNRSCFGMGDPVAVVEAFAIIRFIVLVAKDADFVGESLVTRLYFE